jgi:isopenicillin N synthase-like dioxygenase
VRFVVDIQDQRSTRRKGVFAALGVLKKHPDISTEDFRKYRELAEWFNQNLEMPNRFNRSTRPNVKPKALSWFKDSAKDYIAKTREVANLLEKYGIGVTMLKTKKPGYILYESENQIVAEPYNDTPT